MQLSPDIFISVSLKRYAAGSFSGGRWSDGAESDVTITASVQPAASSTAHPDEGERAKDSINVWSQDPIYALDDETGRKGDRILWEGEYYRVEDVNYHRMTPELTHYNATAVKEQKT